MREPEIFDEFPYAYLFEVLVALGLAINALGLSEASPISGNLSIASGLFVFGVGVLGIAVIASSKLAGESKYRRSACIYGGSTLVLTAPAIISYLVFIGRFDNLFGVLILAVFAADYYGLWFLSLEWD